MGAGTPVDAELVSVAFAPARHPRKTRAQWIVLSLLFLTSMVTFVDRVNISIAGGAIAEEYALDLVQLGTVFSAFVLGYTLFQMPGGWLGDRYGYTRVLAGALVWWSFFTALTAWAGGGALASVTGAMVALCVVRFLIGAGEAAAYPCAIGIIGESFAPHARALPTGVMFAGVGVGSAITPPLIALLMVRFGWRSAFYVCAPIGFLIALFLIRTLPTGSRSRRASHRSQTGAGLPEHAYNGAGAGPFGGRALPLRHVLRNRQLWLLTCGMFLFGYVAYVYYAWFYLYLVDVRGFSLLRGSLLGTLPFLSIAVGSMLGGWLSDHLLPRIGKAPARRRVATAGLSAAAILIPVGATVGNAYVAVGALSLASGAAFLAVTQYWTTAIEIIPERAATVGGIMNTGSNLGGVLSPIVTPWIGQRYGWAWALGLPALFSAAAALLWQVTNPDDVLEVPYE